MNLNKNQIKWILSSIILLIIFAVLTPIMLFFKYGVIISVIESLLCSILIAFALLNISSLNELSNVDKKEESKSLRSILIPFISFVIFAFLIYNFMDYKINYKIQNEGIFAQAKVLNGEKTLKKSLRKRTSITHNISLSYKDSLTNKEIYVKTDIKSEIFNAIYKGQTIEIKYLPEYNTIFKVMVGNKNVTKFKNISNRYINFSDLGKLLNLKDEKFQIEYLNSISQGWKKNTDKVGTMFSNELKKEIIAITSDGKIYLESKNLNSFIPTNRIIKTTQIETKKTKNVMKEKNTLYETDSLIITKVHKIIIDFPKAKKENYLLIEKKF